MWAIATHPTVLDMVESSLGEGTVLYASVRVPTLFQSPGCQSPSVAGAGFLGCSDTCHGTSARAFTLPQQPVSFGTLLTSAKMTS